ncbi:MAG: chromosomal replication initiator protein DnaA [Rickettsiales bacterium]|nr:chromosomal replication initiator protein DnaA [Rickettsiales bacterium]
MTLEILTKDNLNQLSDKILDDKVFDFLRQKFGEETFAKWFADLEIISEIKSESSEIIFNAPSKFVRDWIIREFIETKSLAQNLLNLLQIMLPKLKKVSVIHLVKNNQLESGSEYKNISGTSLENSANQKIINLSKYDNVFAFGTELNPRYNFQNFVSGKYNKLALSMAKIVAGLDAQINLFDDKIPLFIHGNVGMGKTHLAQAIAWQIKESNSAKKVVYLSAEKFMYHFVQSIRSNGIMDFKEKIRSIDVLIVDDVQFIAGKESTQQEFMNSFNHLVAENKQVVLVCDRCPSDLENIDEKLKSRISGGMIVNFKNPDYQDRLQILQEKAKLTEQEICPKILSFLAEKITTNVRDLEGALRKLVCSKMLDEQEITLENAKEVLSDYIRAANSSAPTIQKIQKIVAQFYNLKIADLLSNNRARSIARPRQIAMYFAKNFTEESLPKIGKEFGGKNHATVIHSVKLIQNLINSDNNFLQEIKTLEEKIKN